MDVDDALETVLQADEKAIENLEEGPGKQEIKEIRREAIES